ncbi:MAG: peptidase dimerization domain-containing protein, partial [Clostridia bacterium]|nr:peptidase dimerization domain-containing protein [Clostridia bacterium]
IIVARKGIIRFELTVHGTAGHSSKCYEAANAITEAAYKIIELEKMKDQEGITCNCGVIKGGSVANTVAETCSFTADIRFADANQLEWAKNKIKEVAENSTVDGCWCEVRQVSMRPAMEGVPANYKLAARINEISEKVGLPVLAVRRGLGGADSAYTTQAGIPTIDSIGVEGFCIHSRKEYAIKKSLALSAKQQAAVVCFI